MTRRILRAAVTGSLLMALAGAARAQTESSTTPNTPLKASATLVFVPTLVQMPSRDLVYALNSSDFILTDNNIVQNARLESEARRPLSLVVLMQTGGVARSHFKDYAHLDIMLASILGGAPNEVSIVNFDSRPEAASEFTSDITQWQDAIDQPDAGDGGAAILDAVSFALDLLAKQPPERRRVIVVISQDHDDGSKTKLKEIVRDIGETNTAIYSFTFSTEKTKIKDSLNDAHLNAPITLNQAAGPTQGYFDLGAALMLLIGEMKKNLSAEVAKLSGGEPSSFSDKAGLDQAMNVLNDRLRSGYVLSFTPTSKQPGLHTLKVRVKDHPEFLVSARTGYWAGDDK